MKHPMDYGQSRSSGRKSPPFYRALVAGGMLGVAGMAFAQTVQPPKSNEEIIELSPFAVEASTNAYVAKSTLGSTRIRSDVADVGSSISILTEQLMEDLAGTDAGSLLTIVPNMEIAGELGNYSAGSTNADANVFQASEARQNNNPVQRVRGLVSAQTTRNYFQTIIPFDTYNTSRVTINRGPNSVLFGLGSPGGIIENSISRPQSKDQIKLQVTASNYGTLRETFDINRVLLNGRLKVRAALMNEDKKFRQEEAFEKDHRAFFTWDYKLRKAKKGAFLGDTTVRGYVEGGNSDRNPPDPIPPTVGYQHWYNVDAVQKLVGVYPGINTVADLDGQYRTLAQGGTFVPMATIDGLAKPSQANRTRTLTPAFIAMMQVYEQPNANPGIFDLSGYMPRVTWGGARGTQDQKVTLSDLGSDFAGFNSPSLMDPNVFDFVNHLYSGDTDTLKDRFNVQEFTLEQEMMNGDLGFEMSYNRQSVNSFSSTPYSSNRARRIAIDVSTLTSIPEVLPTPAGSVTATLRNNPNLGRPVMSVNSFNQSTGTRDLESFRTTAYLKHDFNDNFKGKLGKIIGQHTLSALYQKNTDRNKSLTETMNWRSDSVDLNAANIFGQKYNQQRAQVQTFVYVGDSVLGTTGPEQVRWNFPLSKSVVPVAGQTGTFTYWDKTTKQVKTTEAYPIWVPNASSSRFNEQRVASDAYILQSHWLDDQLVTLFAVRNDSVRNFEVLPAAKVALADNSMDLSSFHLQDTPASEFSGQTITKSYVLKFPEKYLFELPWDSDLRVSYFESETFDPVRTRRGLDGAILPSPNGTTKEYGFGVDMFNRRLSLNVNWYETGSNGASKATGLSSIVNWAGSDANWLKRAAEAQNGGVAITAIPGNADGHIASYADLYSKLKTVLPASYTSQVTVNFDPATASATSIPIDGLTSTFDYVSKGMEIELGGAITRNWNIVFNVAKQETVQSNTLPGVLAFAELVAKNIVDSGLAPLTDSPNLGVSGSTYAQRWASEVLFPVRAEIAKDGTKSPEQRKWRWNLVSSYHFDQGPIKGVTVGAVARWQDKAAIGYPVILDSSGNVVQDIAHPYYGETDFNADAWIAYKRKLTKTVGWKVQLNVRNLIGGNANKFIPISINPIGDVQAIRTSPERQILLTNTFSF